MPQHTTIAALRKAWREVDNAEFHSVWTEDHFFPLSGDPDGSHFECWSILGAMAVETSNTQFGPLVTCCGYRNPDLLADMARTIDVLSGGRFVLGIGAGWFQRDYMEYGYEFGNSTDRVRALEFSLRRIRLRMAKLNPRPIGSMSILIGGGGEKVLRLAAMYAQVWNYFARGSASQFDMKNKILDEWCVRLGRDPREIERSVALRANEIDQAEAYIKAGAAHLIVSVTHPFDLRPVHALLIYLHRRFSE